MVTKGLIYKFFFVASATDLMKVRRYWKLGLLWNVSRSI